MRRGARWADWCAAPGGRVRDAGVLRSPGTPHRCSGSGSSGQTVFARTTASNWLEQTLQLKARRRVLCDSSSREDFAKINAEMVDLRGCGKLRLHDKIADAELIAFREEYQLHPVEYHFFIRLSRSWAKRRASSPARRTRRSTFRIYDSRWPRRG